MTRPMSSSTSAHADRRARLWLLAQLREEHFSVRVGAIYGLAYHLADAGVVDALKAAERLDESAEVRIAAALVLSFGSSTDVRDKT